MANAAHLAAIQAHQAQVIVIRNQRLAANATVPPRGRSWPGLVRATHTLLGDFALAILFEDMPALDRFDRECIWNYVAAPDYMNFGWRTHYNLNDRWHNRDSPGREHPNWLIVEEPYNQLSQEQQQLRDQIHTDIFNAAALMGIVIPPQYQRPNFVALPPPAVNQPVVNQPVINQPVINQPVINQPTVNLFANASITYNTAALNVPVVNTNVAHVQTPANNVQEESDEEDLHGISGDDDGSDRDYVDDRSSQASERSENDALPNGDEIVMTNADEDNDPVQESQSENAMDEDEVVPNQSGPAATQEAAHQSANESQNNTAALGSTAGHQAEQVLPNDDAMILADDEPDLFDVSGQWLPEGSLAANYFPGRVEDSADQARRDVAQARLMASLLQVEAAQHRAHPTTLLARSPGLEHSGRPMGHWTIHGITWLDTINALRIQFPDANREEWEALLLNSLDIGEVVRFLERGDDPVVPWSEGGWEAALSKARSEYP